MTKENLLQNSNVESLWLELLSKSGGPRFSSFSRKILDLTRSGELKAALEQLSPLDAKARSDVARAFSLYLEVINCFETAYRTHRLRLHPRVFDQKSIQRITLVLTAHPTESRSPQLIDTLDRITHLFLESLNRGVAAPRDELGFLMSLAWNLPFARHKKPTVLDEAYHIYSILLSSRNLQLLTSQPLLGKVFFRSWAGGDKDGHPGVTRNVFVQSLTLSRRLLCWEVQKNLVLAKKDLQLLSQGGLSPEPFSQAEIKLGRVVLFAKSLQSLKAKDGRRLSRFRQEFQECSDLFNTLLGYQSPHMSQVEKILVLFPGLVVPLEFREDAREIRLAAAGRPKEITRMLVALSQISTGGKPMDYVRGLVVSMAHSPEDLLAAFKLVNKVFRAPLLPIVPLFETAEALGNSVSILDNTFKDKAFMASLKNERSSFFEVMLGYSDSSKESGALFSRREIQKSMFALDKFLVSKKLRPIFFHGSGGSVARGGGSVEDQTAWWPDSAVRRFKATIQGEMVHRTFATPEILMSSLSKLAAEADSRGREESRMAKNLLFSKFVLRAQAEYQEQIKDPEFMRIVSECTPYSYLRLLKMGSRPSQRKDGPPSMENLRAIPWVLCWTQTRLLFPAWWGVGSAWSSLSEVDREGLRSFFDQSYFVRSFVKLLGFTLAKVRLEIFAQYLLALSGDKAAALVFLEKAVREYQLTLECVQYLSGERNPLWYRPWLADVIKMRNPLVDVVNLCQILAIKNNEESLLRETTTGIASGMLTTG